MHAYIVTSLLTGARTEEMRPLTWDHVDLTGKPEALPPVPPNIRVWRSVRLSNETKTGKSRRSLALAQRAVDALTTHRARQNVLRGKRGTPGKTTTSYFRPVSVRSRTSTMSVETSSG
jgi:integrase